MYRASQAEESLLCSPRLLLHGDGLVFTQVALQMWLSLQRHDPGSPWAPYLRALPNMFDLPFLWPVRHKQL